ncbi:MAG TPA: hypothetical protein VLJ57_23335 [Burkholderiaceae bacterium]|nr:hypothetical protein [Burkholderiaceae bacterium]
MQLPPVDRNLNWRPPGADLYSTGASGAVPVRPINPANPVESTDYIGGGVVPGGPDKPSVKPETPNRDWTTVSKQVTAEEPPEPPKEPISKQLLEFLQAMWRAGGAAILEATEEATKAANKPANLLQEPLTYSDPKVKKSSRL